jgi:chromosome segregation ATPase
MSIRDEPPIAAGEGPEAQPSGQPSGLRARIASQAEDTIGKLADDLLENPVINSALSGAFAAREKVAHAQQSAMEALNLPLGSDVEKLGRRLRSISQRLEEVEDGVDTLGTKLQAMSDASRAPAARLSEQIDRLDSRIEQLSRDVAALRAQASSSGGLAGEPPAPVVG